MKRWFIVFCIICLSTAFTGCIDTGDDDDDDDDAAVESSSSSSSSNLPFSLSDVVWLYTDVSGWAETGTLNTVALSGDTLILDYDKTNVWPNVDRLNANPWVFMQASDGTWYAGIFEYMRQGYASRPKATVNGAHVQKAPMNGSWKPTAGQQYGFMVSGLARGGYSNVQERTNVVMLTWE
ncbi:MAG: hypothetical protein KAI43_11930 [Candidatus Aureabacteria bacterium]|nr:hypothetical protein [Candidatus Auribacterota bacterium]